MPIYLVRAFKGSDNLIAEKRFWCDKDEFDYDLEEVKLKYTVESEDSVSVLFKSGIRISFVQVKRPCDCEACGPFNFLSEVLNERLGTSSVARTQ